MKLLLIIDMALPNPVIYADKVDVNFKTEFRAALDSSAIFMPDDEIDSAIKEITTAGYSEIGAGLVAVLREI